MLNALTDAIDARADAYKIDAREVYGGDAGVERMSAAQLSRQLGQHDDVLNAMRRKRKTLCDDILKFQNKRTKLRNTLTGVHNAVQNVVGGVSKTARKPTLQERRAMQTYLLAVFRRKQSVDSTIAPDECARAVELDLFRSARFREEYLSPQTLKKRIQESWARLRPNATGTPARVQRAMQPAPPSI